MTVESTIERVARAYDEALKILPYPEAGSPIASFQEQAMAIALSSLRPGDPLPGGMVVRMGEPDIAPDDLPPWAEEVAKEVAEAAVKALADGWLRRAFPELYTAASLSNQETKAE